LQPTTRPKGTGRRVTIPKRVGAASRYRIGLGRHRGAGDGARHGLQTRHTAAKKRCGSVAVLPNADDLL
jgi:hypothetical protein